MKSIFYADCISQITSANRRIKKGLYVFNKIKHLSGIKYIEELCEEELSVQYSQYQNHPDIYIMKEIEPEIVCSVAGEIEDVLKIAHISYSSIDQKAVYYDFFDGSGRTFLRITLGKPKCEWVIEKEEIHHHHSEYTSTTREGYLKCV